MGAGHGSSIDWWTLGKNTYTSFCSLAQVVEVYLDEYWIHTLLSVGLKELNWGKWCCWAQGVQISSWALCVKTHQYRTSKSFNNFLHCTLQCHNSLDFTTSFFPRVIVNCELIFKLVFIKRLGNFLLKDK